MNISIISIHVSETCESVLRFAVSCGFSISHLTNHELRAIMQLKSNKFSKPPAITKEMVREIACVKVCIAICIFHPPAGRMHEKKVILFETPGHQHGQQIKMDHGYSNSCHWSSSTPLCSICHFHG